jgi:vacuolar-type H+-ATPase subunit E/Vma4
MSLDDIKKSILTDASAQAEKIEAEGKIKISEIKKIWQLKLDEKKQEIIDSAQRKANQKVQQTQFKLQSQAQSEVLEQKQRIIDKVYKTALQKLAAFDGEKYIGLASKLIESLPEGEGELFSTKEKDELLKKALKRSGKKLKISPEPISGTGGFIFQSEQIEINNTFLELINNSKEQTILEVTRLLFSDRTE